MSEYNENNFLRDKSLKNSITKVSLNRSFVSDNEQNIINTKSLTEMDFNNNNENAVEEELKIRASDIILLPYNPDGENISIKAGND